MGALDCVSADRIKSTDSTEVFTINMSSNSCLNEPRRDVESQFSKTSGRRHSVWWTLGIDVPLAIVVSVLIVLYELGVLPQNKFGFFCNDPALAFPYTGETISAGVLMSTVVLIPFVVVFITELFYVNVEYSQSRVKESLMNTLRVYRSYVFGFFFNIGLVEVLKGISGIPRPTFFDLCEPDTGKTCNGSEFVSSFTCTSTRYSSWLQADSYSSFPSGHTSLSVYCAFFTAWYLQQRAFDWRGRTVFLVPVIQICLITYAALCSLTRITDHRHHWWDVLAGTVLGVVCLFYAVLVLCKNFSTLKTEAVEESQQSRTLLFDGRRRDLVVT